MPTSPPASGRTTRRPPSRRPSRSAERRLDSHPRGVERPQPRGARADRAALRPGAVRLLHRRPRGRRARRRRPHRRHVPHGCAGRPRRRGSLGAGEPQRGHSPPARRGGRDRTGLPRRFRPPPRHVPAFASTKMAALSRSTARHFRSPPRRRPSGPRTRSTSVHSRRPTSRSPPAVRPCDRARARPAAHRLEHRAATDDRRPRDGRSGQGSSQDRGG